MTKGIGLCGSGNRDCSAISIRISEKALMDNGKANTKASEDFGQDDILAIMKEYVLGVTERASTTVCVVAGAMEQAYGTSIMVDKTGDVTNRTGGEANETSSHSCKKR